MRRAVNRLLTGYEQGAISRRDLVLALAGLAATPASAQPGRAPIEVSSLNHATMFVPDPERSIAFYRELFGMPVLSRQGGGANLAAGSGGAFVGIFGGPGTEPAIDHLCLGVTDFDRDRIVAQLEQRGLEPRVRMRDDAIPEIYVRDPDGIQLQIQDEGYCGGSGELGDDCG
jgi:catechol 2,3-dioxygenase-like lactoylglutathione lyase family enzyme